MKKFLSSTWGKVTAVVIAVLVIAGIVFGIVMGRKGITGSSNKDDEPKREFHILDEDESEEQTNDGLQVGGDTAEEDIMNESGFDFSGNGNDTPSSNGGDGETPTEQPNDTPNDDPSNDAPNDEPNEDDPDAGLNEGVDTSDKWGPIV